MEDIKWFIKKFGIIFVILLVMIVSVGIFSNRSIKSDSKLVPIIDLITNFLPILKSFILLNPSNYYLQKAI